MGEYKISEYLNRKEWNKVARAFFQTIFTGR